MKSGGLNELRLVRALAEGQIQVTCGVGGGAQLAQTDPSLGVGSLSPMLGVEVT